jgi:hypothetical protein
MLKIIREESNVGTVDVSTVKASKHYQSVIAYRLGFGHHFALLRQLSSYVNSKERYGFVQLKGFMPPSYCAQFPDECLDKCLNANRELFIFDSMKEFMEFCYPKEEGK